jgi:hypothetical protein
MSLFMFHKLPSTEADCLAAWNLTKEANRIRFEPKYRNGECHG